MEAVNVSLCLYIYLSFFLTIYLSDGVMQATKKGISALMMLGKVSMMDYVKLHPLLLGLAFSVFCFIILGYF